MEKIEKNLTGDKNLDSIILNNLNDEDLINFCLSGDYGRALCNYETFWSNRLKARFPYFLEIRPEKYIKNSKNYYAYLVKTISKILERFGIKIKNITQDTLKDLNKHHKNEALKWISRETEEHLEILKYIIENGADIYKSNECILINLSEHGHLETVKYLVQNGANVRECDDALVRAFTNGHLEIGKYLVKNGAIIHPNDGRSLVMASIGGYLEIVKYLVENGVNIHVDEDAALRFASDAGKLEVVKYLVQNGANVHAKNDEALLWAKDTHPEVANYLEKIMKEKLMK